MSIHRTSLITAALVVAALGTAASAQGATAMLSTEAAPTRVAAWEGTVMWSKFDPVTKTYVLVKSVAGAPAVPVGVRARSGGPFDIDLGTNRSGATYAVYTRAGDIYRLNVASGAETRITRLSSPVLAERDPTIQRGRIAFIRRVGGFDQLRIGGTTNAAEGTALLARGRSIVSAELGINHIAYVQSAGRELDVHVRNLAGEADRIVYRARSGGANAAVVTRPTYMTKPQGFLWARTNVGSGAGNRLVRYTVGGAKLTYAAGSPRYNTTAWAGAALGAVTGGSLDPSNPTQGSCSDSGVQYCVVGLTGPLQFNLKP
jgi:hypothetical protein